MRLDFHNPVVLFANAVGDHVIFAPTLRALAELFPNKITFVSLPNAAPTFFNEIPLKDVVELKSKVANLNSWNLGTKPGDIQNFDEERIIPLLKGTDLLITPNYWYSSPLDHLINAVSPRVVIGIRPELPINVFQQKMHSFDQYFCVAKYLCPELNIEGYAYPIHIQTSTLREMKSFDKNNAKDKKILVVHMDTKKRKRCSPKLYTEVIEQFLSIREEFLAVIIGLEHEIELASLKNRSRIFDFCGYTLTESFEIIQKANLFIGIDSCMLHVADLSRIPGIGFFGPTSPLHWGFRFSNHYHVNFADTQPDAGYVVELLNNLNHIK